MWMGSSSIFGGIFGRREIGGNSNTKLSTQLKWLSFAKMIFRNIGLPWRQGQLLLKLQIFRVAMFQFSAFLSLAVLRTGFQ